MAEPGSALFADRVNEVRWLIVIDGLHEIHDPDRRHELLNALHQRILHSCPYRLVILSRPLPPGELELLRGSDLGEYTLQPFDAERLAEFTRHWFEAQGAAQVDKEVARFLDHVEESYLGEVVHIPLLATIAVAMQTTSPERPLPATQVELHERFVAELLDARPLTTGAKADWREWLHEFRAALLPISRG